MSKKLTEIVKKLQFLKDWTIEDVAKSIGYSRVHLTKEMKKSESSNLEELLLVKHHGILQNDSKNKTDILQNDSKKGISSDNVYKDEYIQSLKDQIQILKEKNDDLKSHCSFLEKSVLVNFDAVLKNQVIVQAQVAAASRVAAERHAGTDRKKLQDEFRRIDKYVAERMKEGV